MFTRRRKIFVAACALLATGLLIGGCRGRCGHRDPDRARKFATRKVNSALDDLDASEEQRALVLKTKDRLFDDGLALRTQARGDRQQVLEQWEADTPDAASLHTLIDTRVDTVRAFAHTVADELVQIHAALTPSQRAQVSKRIREHMADHDE